MAALPPRLRRLSTRHKAMKWFDYPLGSDAVQSLYGAVRTAFGEPSA
jgi:hypothetical protein